MSLNNKLGMIGASINVISVLLFAVFMLIPFDFGSYFVCMFLSIGFVMMIAAFEQECSADKKTAGKTASIFAGMYAVLVFIVYFTQCTTVANEALNSQVSGILDYKNMGWLFNLDLLGYGMMALSTFFIGLAIDVKNKKDKALRILLLIHGIFFISCLIMPMTGVFADSGGAASAGGVIALEFWCLYFLPAGVLSFFHFKKNK